MQNQNKISIKHTLIEYLCINNFLSIYIFNNIQFPNFLKIFMLITTLG